MREIKGTLAFSILLLFACVRSDPSRPPSPPTAEPKSADTITFAGISGVPPRFIDSGPMKGMGTLEFETRPIRKGMLQSGFEIQVEYFTPARIAHEFRTKRPICFYPTEWTHPEALFKTKPDRIYSIPFDLGGESTASIIIRKEDSALFKPFVDAKGDVAIFELLKAHHLKTQLVRDKDYGPLTSLVSFTSSSGDQEVRTEYRKNIEIRLISDNRQIIEMLNAKRFDYAFYDDIEAEDFKKTKLDPSKFAILPFQTGRVQDENDPNLVRLSISCSDTPITQKAMPYFNHWISLTRGMRAGNRSQNYRTALDPKYSTTYSILNITPQRFRGLFQSGKLDDWYALQQKHFPGLERFPPIVQEASQESNGAKQMVLSEEEPKWVALNTGTSLLVVNQTGIRTGFGTYPDRWHGLPSFETVVPQVFPFSNVLKSLPPEEEVMLTSRPDLFANGSGRSVVSLNLNRWPDIRSLTVFGGTLQTEDIESLKLYFENHPLERLNLLSLSSQAAKVLFPSIPRSVTHLNLTHSSLTQTDLSKKLLQLQLKSLDLTASQMTADQFQSILPSLEGLEVLTLRYLRTIWTQETAKSFARLKWNRLKKLDLENTALSHRTLVTLIPSIPPTLEALSLKSNGLSQESLYQLFSKPFPKLHSLDLSLNYLGSTRKRVFRFPAQVRTLTLQNCGLNDERFSQIFFPREIESLDLSYNSISDSSFKIISEFLSRRITRLDLTYTRPSEGGMREFLKALQGRSIEELNLAHVKITDSLLHTLCSDEEALRIKGLRKLDLQSNQITSEGVRDLAKFYLNHLEQIGLSVNPIGKSGVAILAKNLGPSLQSLDLADLPDLAMTELAPRLPPGLTALDLGENQISDEEMELLAPHLPRNLRSLGLSRSTFSERGTRALSQHFPPLLETLDLIGSSATQTLFSTLPPSLKHLRIGLGDLKEGHFPPLPAGLLTLWGERVSADSQILAHFVNHLPRSLEKLRIYSKPLAYQNPEPILWPPSLRELYTEGLSFNLTSHQLRNQAFGHLPSTLERLDVLAGGLDDPFLELLANKGMKNLNIIQASQSHFSFRGINQFLLATPGLSQLAFIPNEFPSTIDTRSLSAQALDGIRQFYLARVPLTGPQAIDLFRKLPDHIVQLNISSTARIEHQHLKRLLEVTPRGVRLLAFFSNEMGAKSREMLLEFKKKREAEDGAFLDMLE